MYYSQNGKLFGAEQYLPNRRVRWSTSEGKCETGEWYPDGNLICFVYQGDPDPKCWAFNQTPAGISAYYENDPAQTTLFVTKESTIPLLCLGPEVGV